MKKVLIISTSLEEQKMMEDIVQVHSNGRFEFETTASFGQDSVWWFQHAPDVLVMSLPEDDFLQAHYFIKMKRDLPPTLPVVFVCSTVTSELMKLSQHFKQMRTLKAPVTGFHLFKSVTDISTDYGPGKNKAQPRYLSDQDVTLHCEYKGGRMKGKIRNISASGAYVESKDKGITLAVGDIVRMIIPVTKIKTYDMDAKLIWSKEVGEPGWTGYGFSFVSNDEVFNTLLKDL